MSQGTKTDNHNTPAKLELRRYFLRKYHAEAPPLVLDCCQGSGKLWGTLRQEFQLAGVWGVDLKPKKGRLKIDSSRILAQPGWKQTVVDVDTYGSPWKHWKAMLPNVCQPTTVFLTIGSVGFGQIDHLLLDWLGITFEVTPGIGRTLHGVSLPYALDQARHHSLEILETVEAENPGGSARYIGLHLIPAHQSAPQPTQGRRKRTGNR